MEQEVITKETKKALLNYLSRCYYMADSMEVDYESEEYDSQREIMCSAYDAIVLLAGEDYAKKKHMTRPEDDWDEDEEND